MKNSIQAVAALSAAGTFALVQAASNKERQLQDSSSRMFEDDGNGHKLLSHHVVRSEKTQARRLQSVCTNCHVSDTGTPIGPSVFDQGTCLFGKPAGTTDPAFEYSQELKDSGLIWNETTLDRWLEDPMAMVNGTKMTFEGLSDPEQRKAIIDSLKESCDSMNDDDMSTDAPTTSAGSAASMKVSYVNTALLSAGLLWFLAAGGRK